MDTFGEYVSEKKKLHELERKLQALGCNLEQLSISLKEGKFDYADTVLDGLKNRHEVPDMKELACWLEEWSCLSRSVENKESQLKKNYNIRSVEFDF